MPPNENRKVWLSRADRNDVTAGMPSAPWRFSTTTGWPHFGEPFRDHARRQVHAAAGRQRHDEANGALRPGWLELRLRVRGDSSTGEKATAAIAASER